MRISPVKVMCALACVLLALVSGVAYVAVTAMAAIGQAFAQGFVALIANSIGAMLFVCLLGAAVAVSLLTLLMLTSPLEVAGFVVKFLELFGALIQ
jgi:hypothetical protein